jgi:hypothetical protein
MDDVRGRIEGVTRLYQQLGQALSGNGSFGDLLALHRRIREPLEAISAGELETLLSDIQQAREGLHHLQQQLIEMRVLKEAFAASRPTRLGKKNQ